MWPGPAAGDAALCHPVGCRVCVRLFPLGTTLIRSGEGWRLPRPSLHVEKMGKLHQCGPSAHLQGAVRGRSSHTEGPWWQCHCSSLRSWTGGTVGCLCSPLRHPTSLSHMCECSSDLQGEDRKSAVTCTSLSPSESTQGAWGCEVGRGGEGDQTYLLAGELGGG